MLRHEARRAYAWLETNVADISQQQATWRPPGTANSIAATYAHTVISADVDLNRHFHSREPVIDGAWTARLGLTESFPDDWPEDLDIDWEALHQYGREVQTCVEGLFDSVTMADLGRRFEMRALVTKTAGKPPELVSLGTWKGIDLYTLHGGGGHIYMHGGEIACLKGLQGGQGYRNFRYRYP